jgi:uncharacterized RDD family membrane protein YckC
VSRWTESWLSGPEAVLEPNEAKQRWRGERLGLPESGAGAVASTGRRVAAFLIDILLSAMVAGLFTAPQLPRNWSLLSWATITILATAVFGFTPGMAALGIRVARLDGSALVGVPRAVLRTALIFAVVPAVIWDADTRCLHDKITGTVVVRTR